MKKESLIPLPKFISDHLSTIYYLQLIIEDLQKPIQSSTWPHSDRCPCSSCHECNKFFTHMKKSSLCPCHAIEEDKVSCDDVILRLKDAITRLKQIEQNKP